MEIKFTTKGQLIFTLPINTNEVRSYAVGNGKSEVRPDVVLPFNVISRNHASIHVANGKIKITDNFSKNGIFVNDRKLQQGISYNLNANDIINFSQSAIVQAIVFNTSSKITHATQVPDIKISDVLAKKPVVIIGRDAVCDIVLYGSNVSRNHASVEKKGEKIYITDLGSKNGTYVNGARITGSHVIQAGDTILIGSTKLSLNKQAQDILNEIAIKLINVQKVFDGNKIGLQTISLSIKSSSLVGIMGPSGCGKSTLLKAITGDSPATSGQILIHGLELVENYEYIKTNIGYVPQDDIIHRELSVQQCLYYSAKLRIENAGSDFVNQQIQKVLSQLNITETRYQLVSSLSGGQRKRVSIAVELLNDPFILFLDEPTSPLDPQGVEEFLSILKNLALHGTTVVLVTHKPEDLAFLDEVLFLGKNGYPLFFDKVSKHLGYFDVDKTVSVYPKISDPSSPQFQQYYEQFKIANPLSGNHTFNSDKVSSIKSFGFFRQLFWLTKRYANIKTNDVANTAILLLQAPVIAFLIVLIFDRISISLLFLMSISAIWFGTNNAAREIVVEKAIYKRERMYNLNILTYLLSKIIVLALFALIQTFIFIAIIYFYFNGKQVELTDFVGTSVWFLSLSFVSILFGLFLSALAKTNEQVASIIPIALIPQIMLAGVLAKISTMPVEILSYFTISRWGTEGFSNIQKEVVTSMQTMDANGVTVTNEYIMNTNSFIIDQFHDKYSNKSIFGDMTGTFSLDNIALSVIAILLLSFTLYLLKKKDTI